jgi:penicillin-binding protein 1A
MAGAYLMVAYFGPGLVGAIYSSNQLGIDLAKATKLQLATLVARIKYPAEISPNPSKQALLQRRAHWLLESLAKTENSHGLR